MRSHQRDYIVKRPGSQFWRVRFQFNGKAVERSLKTTDKAEAEILALPLIAEHKRRLLEARPKLVPTWVPQYQPGLHTLDDGQKIFATARELHFLDDKGATIRTEPNGCEGHDLVNVTFPLVIAGKEPVRPELAKGAMVIRLNDLKRPKLATKDADDEVIEKYIEHKKFKGKYAERETRVMWALYKQLIGKPLKNATRDDGRKLVEHLKSKGAKDGTVKKRLNRLTAAVNLAIRENRGLTFNPFSGVITVEDADEKLPLNDADMAVCRASLYKLSASDQLLFRLLACTGMRLAEALAITTEEHPENGVRFVIVAKDKKKGRKTKQSKRRAPFPADVLPYLPKKIAGRLFVGNANTLSGRLNDFIDACGITDPLKSLHSLRHRAQDKLRAAGCPLDVREELLGHDKVTVGKHYGIGSPVTVLKKWIDKIGM